MSDAKWKNWLLKSSLPLEFSVAATLARSRWDVQGQYTYSRTNESGASVDFSADLHACQFFSSATHTLGLLDLLLECKYASPGVKWIFLPYPEESSCAGGLIQVIDHAANKKAIARDSIEALERAFPYCIRGIALHESGFDECVITRGAAQLRYAMPNLIGNRLSHYLVDWCDEDIFVTFACSILVTTAPLYCLKEGLSLTRVHAAEALEEVATPCDAVVLWEPGTPDLARYAGAIYDQLPSQKLASRIESYAAVFRPTSTYPHPKRPADAARAMRDCGNHVLVLNLNRLESVLQTLSQAVKSSVHRIERIAEVQYDRTTRRYTIAPIETPDPPPSWGPIEVDV